MQRNQRGDSLIEIIIAIVVIGLVVSAVVAAISTSENGSASHRELVTGDTVMRNYAEAVKQAVRTLVHVLGRHVVRQLLLRADRIHGDDALRASRVPSVTTTRSSPSRSGCRTAPRRRWTSR